MPVADPDRELVLTIYAQKNITPDLARFLDARPGLDSVRLPRFVDAGTSASGDRWVAVEPVVGSSLAKLVEGGALPATRVIGIGVQASEGLSMLHAAGLVHGGLSPQTLIVGDASTVLIGENGSGERSGDLKALAAALYHALYARAWTSSTTFDSTADALGLVGVLQRCLAGSADNDFANADELRAALKALIAPPTLREVDKVTPAAQTRRPTNAGSAVDQEPSPPKPAGTVLGSYRLIDILGEGGMGIVYHAEHVRLGRRVALKLLRSELSGDPLVISRFFAEARAVNQINHDNIVEITDFVENPSGDNYYIMEFLAGLNLKQMVERDGELKLSRALGISVQVCSALASVHDAGIVHRDLKPENIFLTERGGQKDFVKLLDFGIAKLGEKEQISTHKTGAGMIVGTPEYMSPEQASGIAVDQRSDIYALGLILYELITTKNPFDGANFGEMVVKRLSTVPPPPSTQAPTKNVPNELDELVMQCIKMRREDRPETIGEVETRLRTIAATYDVDLETFVERPAATRPAAKRAPIIPLAAAFGLLAVIGAFVALRPHAAPPVPVAPPVVTAPVVAPTPAPTPPAPIPLAEVPSEPTVDVRAPSGKHVAKIARHHDRKSKNQLDGPGRHAVIDPFK